MGKGKTLLRKSVDMKPTLTPEQKAFLMLELMEWVTANTAIMGANSPREQTFKVLHAIQDDKSGPVVSSNGEIFIRELKENGILWAKILPFIKNAKAGCTSKVVEPEAYGTCHHSKDQHIDGKCIGVHRSYYVDGKHLNHPKETPCSCTKYKSTQTW